VDFDLSPEHELLRRTIRDYATREIESQVDEHEAERRFPTDIVAELGQMGLLGIPFPEEEGGAGLDTLAYAIAIEELARVWGSLAIIVAAHTSLGCSPIHIAGTDDQKQRFLVPMAQGRVLGAYGLTEPEAGSDSGGTRTTAKFEKSARGNGGKWVLNGSKRFITNAGQAGTYIVTARTGGRPDGSPEISAFIVESGTPGFLIGRLEEKLGLHASATGELLFEDCRIPADQMLGAQGEGWKIFLKTLDGGRISIGAMAVGLSQAALDASVTYARERKQFGRPIGSFQGVAFMVAEIEAARQMVWRAAWLKDNDRDYTTAAAQAKLFASEVSQRATNMGIQVHGGYGYVEEYKVERFMRDAKLTELGEGTSQIQRLVIGRKVLGLRVE
jgi:butyryl-CoA dehydrogenase